MALNNFIPVLWSARLLENLHKTMVYAQAPVVNTDYEGEITGKGSSVKINSIGPVTVKAYTKDTDIDSPETLTDAQSTLLIDQADYFNFQVDDIDAAQQTPKVMDAAMREAAYGLAMKADSYVAGLYAGVAVGNTVGDDTTPIVPTKTTAYEYLVDLGVLLSENNIPAEGRWVVIPPWYYGLILKDDRFTSAANYGATTALWNGEVGMAAGFRILQSNNVPNTAGAKYKIIAGHPMAITYADQINKVEAFRPEKRFADAVKGLHTYGSKLVRSNAIAVLTVSKS